MRGFIKKIRTSPVFRRILLLLSAMTVIMFGINFFFLKSLLAKEYHERTEDALNDILVTADEFIAQNLLSEGQAMQQTMWNDTMTEAILLADEMSPYQKQEIAKILSNYEREHTIAARTWLFTYPNDMCYGSDGTVCAIGESPAAQFFPEYSDSAMGKTLRGKGIATTVCTNNGRAALWQDFPTPERNGALVVELNEEALLEPVRAAIEESEDFLEVWDGSGHILSVLGAIDGTLPERQTLTGQTGWIYSIRQSSDTSGISAGYVIRMIGFWIILFAVIGMTVVPVISGWIYRPIGTLSKAVLKEPDKGNELDLVRTVYEDTVKEKRNLADKVSEMAPFVRERLYGGLLRGREYDAEYLRERLAFLESPFRMEYVFRVIMAAPENRDEPTAEEKMSSLYRYFGRGRSGDGTICREGFLTDDYILVIIMGCPKTVSVSAVKKEENRLTESLLEAYAGEKTKAKLIVSHGGSYVGIENLNYSYADAREELNYRIYNKTDSDCADRCDDSIRLRSVRVAKAAAEGDVESAKTMLGGYISDVSDPDEGMMFVDTLMGELLANGVKSDDMEKLNVCYHRMERQDTETGAEQIRRILEEAGMFAIQILSDGRQKNQNKYVIRAKEYMQEHYSDRTLSQDAVAQSLGINSAYLSRLFKEYNDTSFVNFLNGCRVSESMKMLSESTVSAEEIGFRCGFNSVQNFTRVFKKITGMTPGAYRKKTTEPDQE